MAVTTAAPTLQDTKEITIDNEMSTIDPGHSISPSTSTPYLSTIGPSTHKVSTLVGTVGITLLDTKAITVTNQISTINSVLSMSSSTSTPTLSSISSSTYKISALRRTTIEPSTTYKISTLRNTIGPPSTYKVSALHSTTGPSSTYTVSTLGSGPTIRTTKKSLTILPPPFIS